MGIVRRTLGHMVDHKWLNHCFVDKNFYDKFFIDYLTSPEYAICNDAFSYEMSVRYRCKVFGPLKKETDKLRWFLVFEHEEDYVFFILQHGNLVLE